MGRERVREGGENKKERDITPANANVSQIHTLFSFHTLRAARSVHSLM